MVLLVREHHYLSSLQYDEDPVGPVVGDVRKTILLNDMLGNAIESVIDMLPGGVRAVALPLEVELLLLPLLPAIVVGLLDVESTVAVSTVELGLLLGLPVVFSLPFEART